MHAWFERAPRATLYTISLLLITVLGSGCGIFSPDESDDGGGTPPAVDFPPATTPDILISNFEKAWENLNILEYEKVLHPDFYFWFSPDDISANGTISWGRADDIDSATNMFGGATGLRIDENGEEEVIPAILSFDMTLNQQEPWRDDFADGAEFEGADFRARYSVTMTVRYTDAGRITNVVGEQQFYVKRVSTVIDGATVEVYQLFAWKDLGKTAGT